MTFQNLHAHTLYDDGRDTPRAMIEAAMAAGMPSMGISLHSPLPFPNGWAAKPESVAAFYQEMRALRGEYADYIDVYAGLEWDSLSGVEMLPGDGGTSGNRTLPDDGAKLAPAEQPPCDCEGVSLPEIDCDYVIGSVHYMVLGGVRCAIDKSADATRAWLRDVFDGNADEAARRYFAQVGSLADVVRVNIVGHFDLLTKFDEQERFFDASRPAYRAAALAAMERLCAAGKIFEINTGAISRGYRTTPYPSRELLSELARMDGRVTVSADAHRAQDIAFGLEDAAALAKACGFRELWVLQKNEFVPVRI